MNFLVAYMIYAIYFKTKIERYITEQYNFNRIKNSFSMSMKISF